MYRDLSVAAGVVVVAILAFFWMTQRAATFTIERVARSSDLRAIDPYQRKTYAPWTAYAITVPASDARVIAGREIYVAASLYDCDEPQDEYPATLDLDGQSLDFDRLAAAAERARSVTFVATIPQSVATRMNIGCVHLRGGSYFLGSGRSAPAKLPA